MKSRTRIEKVPEELLRVIDNAMQVRVAKKIDRVGRKYQNYPRFFKAISRHEGLRKDLENAEFREDERAQSFNIFTFMVFAFLVVLLFAGLIYAQGIIYNIFHDVGIANEVNAGSPGYVNMTEAAEVTFGTLNQSIQALRMVAIVYILGIAIVIIITNSLVKMNPIWFVAYILISLLAVIFSPTISNAYETVLASGIYDNGLYAFTTSNWILLNLPVIVLVISVLGGIFLFVNMIRSNAEGNLG